MTNKTEWQFSYEEKQFEAERLNRAPAAVFAAANKQGALIVHKHYSDKVFLMISLDAEVYYEGRKVEGND